VVAYLYLYYNNNSNNNNNIYIYMHTCAGVCHAQSFVKSRPMTTDWLN
jgi:hypothetical protein